MFKMTFSNSVRIACVCLLNPNNEHLLRTAFSNTVYNVLLVAFV